MVLSALTGLSEILGGLLSHSSIGESLGQDPSGFHLHLDLTLCYNFPYLCPTRRKLFAQECGHTTVHTQVLPGVSCSPSSADTAESTSRTITSALWNTHRGLRTQNREVAWDGILSISISTWSGPCATGLHTQIPLGDGRSPRTADTTESTALHTHVWLLKVLTYL